MLRQYIHLSFFMFLIVALTGVFMRLYPWLSNPAIPYDHVLHAHSHLALLGWEFLAVFVLFLVIVWKQITRVKQAITICFTLVIVSLLMFFAFLYEGYGIFSIALSTLHIFVEYWAAIFIYKQMKSMNIRRGIASLYMKGALVALVISSIGPYALAVISANGWKEYAIFDMAVYFYLHFQYNGWLFLFLFGTFLMILQRKNIPFDRNLFRIAFWVYFISLFPNYLLSILWAEQFGVISHIVGALGSIGQWSAVIIILFACKKSLKNWKSYMTPFIKISISITCFFLFCKSTMELGLISPSLAALVYDTRSVIIGYLHLTLLGFITFFIVTQYWFVGILSINRKSIINYIVFLLGFMTTELLLFAQGLWNWFERNIPFYTEGLLIAAITLAIGVIGIWFSMKPKVKH